MEKVAELMEELCSVPSPSGMEGELAEVVAEFLEERTGCVERFPWGVLVNPEAEVVVCTHLDTATPGKCRVEGEWARGSGACDAKASVCALMLALGEAEPLRIGGAFLVGEESTGEGSEALAEVLEPRMGVVLEPTSLRLATRVYGTLEVEFRVAGRSAHAATPACGVNPVMRSFRLLEELEALPARVSVLRISAGGDVYAVPEECRMLVDLLFPPEVELEELRERVMGLASSYGTAEVVDEAPGMVLRGRCAGLVEEALRRAGVGVRRCSMPSWCDAVNLQLAGWDTVVFGPGELGVCHTGEERVRLEEVRAAAEVLLELNRVVCAR